MNTVAAPLALRLRQAEFALLCVLLLVLPILEAPKNIALAMFALALVARLFVERKMPWRRPVPVEWAVIALMLATVVSTAVNWPYPNGDKGLKDVFSYSIVFLAIHRAGYAPARRYLLAAMAAAGTVIGLVWGFIEVAQGKRWTVELHSVGVVTHSSIYLGVILLLTVGLALFAGDRAQAKADVPLPAWSRYAWWAAAAFMLFSLIAMASRGGIFAAGVALLLLLVMTRSKRFWLAAVLIPALSAAAMYLLPDVFQQSRLVEKLAHMVQKTEPTESEKERFANWRVAIAQITQGDTLLFGVGPRNYPGIDLARLRFDPPLVPGFENAREGVPGYKLKHSHNMFLHKLVEEGVAGLAALVAILVLVAQALVRDARAGRWRQWSWVCGAGALVVPVVAGSFNTPWYNEHALLAMTLFALYLSGRPDDSTSRG